MDMLKQRRFFSFPYIFYCHLSLLILYLKQKSSFKTSKGVKMETNRKVPLLLWPFYAMMQLVIWILKVTGRLLGIVLGVLMVVLGVVLCMTLVGAILGVPLTILGVMLSFKSIF